MAIELGTKLSPSKAAKPKKKLDMNLSALFQGGRITSKDKMFFTERLALFLETGNSIHPSLEALRAQSDNPKMVAIIDELIEDLVGGRSFSSALAKHPVMFSSTYVTLVQASEQGGFMAEVLKQIQAMEEKRDKLQSTLVSAFSYPAFLSVFSGGVVLFILLVVFPKFGKLFTSIRDQLPITTIILMNFSEWATQFWYVLLLGPLAFLYLLKKWLISSGGREITDQIKLRFPVLKDIFIQVYLVNFFRVMSLSLANGVSVMEALESCRDVVDNVVFARFIKRVERYVGEGKGFAIGFNEAEFMPSMVRQTINTGDQTGNLGLVMGKIADFYEREIERKINMLSKMAEPIMLMIMGVVVGVIVSSLILPIFKLGRAVH